MENQNETVNTHTKFTSDVKSFYQADFKNLFVSYFRNPLDEQEQFFKNPSKDAYTHSIILYASVFLIYLVGNYLLAGEMRTYMGLGDYFKIAIMPIILMSCLSLFSFAIKSFFGTNTNIKGELLTGALCGLPLASLIPLTLIGKLFNINLMSFLTNMRSGGMIIALVFLYLILLLINTLYQSLKSGGVKSVTAWYLAPLVVIISIFIAFSFTGGIY